MKKKNSCISRKLKRHIFLSPTEDKQSIKKSGTIKNYSIDGFGSIEWKDSANQTNGKVKDLK